MQFSASTASSAVDSQDCSRKPQRAPRTQRSNAIVSLQHTLTHYGAIAFACLFAHSHSIVTTVSVRRIGKETLADLDPDGLAISVGEQSGGK